MSNVSFVFDHTPQAVLMAGLFALGGAASWAALRWRVEALLAAPRFFARLLTGLLARRPGWPILALVIFTYNATAIFLYMLTGVIPWGAHAVTFLTGFSVVAAGVLAREMLPPPAAPPILSPMAQICGLLTFLLELPCFWYAMAMGSTISPPLWDMIASRSAAPLTPCVTAYLLVIVPTLTLSAAAEGYAIACSLPPERPSPPRAQGSP